MSENVAICFHCGLPLTAKIYYITIKKITQPMCCIGCQMVAQAILENGLENYYEFRDQRSVSQQNVVPPELLELSQYDLTDIQDKYLSVDAIEKSDIKEMILSIDGITCAACIWLLEKRISKLTGVINFSVNLSNHRAVLRWDESQVVLSDVFMQIAKIGYRAQPFELDREERNRQKDYSIALKRLAVSGFGFGQVMMFAAPLYDWFSHGIPVYYRDFFRIVSLVVTTPVLVYCGIPFFKSAWISLKSRFLSMDVSISLALIVVYIAGVYATVMRTGEVYFDSITMFLFFITLSRYLEMRARYHSSFVVQQLSHQQPAWVTRVKNGLSEAISINHVMIGDHIVVKSGATIPIDGVVLVGDGDVSEALLTGEALPKLKRTGDMVVAGSLNIGNPLVIEVSRIGEQTTLATILRLFERAQYDKPKIVSYTQQFSHYFILIQMCIALFLFLFWLPVSIEHAFWITISLLVISCPCALAIATPIGLTAAMNALSKIGFLCTRGHVLESLYKPSDIIFDKTGTLTEGQFSIQSMHIFSDDTDASVMKIAASLEAQSEHPIASAFKGEKQILSCEQVIVHPNQGIEGSVSGEHYYLGNLDFIRGKIPHLVYSELPDSSYTKIILASRSKLLAMFSLEDKLRANAKGTINYLVSQGVRIHLLSGDNEKAVNHYANILGIKLYRSNYSPDDKLNYVKSLQHHGATVVMLGDGINDAPVLMQAQVSIAMATAADLTRVSADAVLMKNDLSVLMSVFDHVKKTHQIIKQCLVWAIIYNLICLPLAVSGLIAPYLAAGLMSLSSIFVVGNALRLMFIKTTSNKLDVQPQLVTANI